MSKGKLLGRCTSCGSEIVEHANDGVFGDGECEACEYQRYKLQPELLKACQLAHDVLCELKHYPFWKSCSYLELEGSEAIAALAKAINNAHEETA